jgi:hypothetical protein
MNQRNDNEHMGLSWVLRVMGWVALVGAVLVAAPIGLLVGEQAGLWALSGVTGLAFASGWLSLEAVRAWRGPVQEAPADSAALVSR